MVIIKLRVRMGRVTVRGRGLILHCVDECPHKDRCAVQECVNLNV